ncbi:MULTISPECIES: hypothetical protein [unclassified Exiguobacterium]|uniref:hypothetical protein n=1 Tax=unclassified Exiguobacterium TaxID=2644629 RepID=UPI00104031DF|nr:MULTISPECIES: hypothetical protein [unclassified Exiguobacterium]TCI42972.1 hypothetical protein EVJ31_13290 [Exiguobacterium sp. SH5S32]TCI49692.1 hypothetical protein EVJ25_13710 [Exiguobacterium sp. SH1S4]TCI67817.1 hypothetical protein EVJ23_13445 [Exiguobacterium sp. SH1S1]
MQSSETKVTSYRVSQEVKENIQRLMEQRQLSTNQLFEELLILAEKNAPDPLIKEEDAVLEASLKQIIALFNERATRLEVQKKEHTLINSRYKKTIQDLEENVILETEQLREKYDQKVESHEIELVELKHQISQLLIDKQSIKDISESERESFKEELKNHKKEIFTLEENLKRLEDERKQLYRQNQSLMDSVDDFKVRVRRIEQLEEENQKLHLEVQLLRREKEDFNDRLKEQVELAVLRERNNNREGD